MNSSEYILKSSREYAIYIATNRAIPSLSDGLKFGQRISLWLLSSRNEKIKTFALGGLMAYEKLYVHGDTSANNTINLLAAPYKNNYCLIHGLGQFGNRVAPDSIGAPRYTDVKKSKVSETILYNDIDLIPMEGNYDKSNIQPIHFLPLVPIVLLNGVSGIAVGWSTEILPHRLKDIIKATKAALNGLQVPTLVPHYERYNITVKATDKPNQWELSGKLEIVNLRNKQEVHITELPPGISLLSFKEFLIELENDSKIEGFTDRSTDNIDISVEVNRETRFVSEDEALNFFKMREKITERIVVLDWDRDKIRTFDNPEQVVKEFAEWRLGWYKKRFQKLITDDKDELIFWEALEVLYQKKFPQKLGTHLNKSDMETEISVILTKSKIKFEVHHLNRITGLATYRWTKDFEIEIKEKIQNLIQKIADNSAILNIENALKQVYISELDAIDEKKF
jgi:DNA gyrase/topoisomerase IV subunit A